MVRMVQATYREVTTRVLTDCGGTKEFGIEVGLHQESALSPFLFITIMDTLSEEVRSDIPWELIFADDIALLAGSEEDLQEKVQRWQASLIRGGLKMSAERKGDTKIKVKDVNCVLLQQVRSFKYLGSELMTEEGVNAAVKHRVQTAWNKWREITGVICDRKTSRKLKCIM